MSRKNPSVKILTGFISGNAGPQPGKQVRKSQSKNASSERENNAELGLGAPGKEVAEGLDVPKEI